MLTPPVTGTVPTENCGIKPNFNNGALKNEKQEKAGRSTARALTHLQVMGRYVFQLGPSYFPGDTT